MFIFLRLKLTDVWYVLIFFFNVKILEALHFLTHILTKATKVFFFLKTLLIKNDDFGVFNTFLWNFSDDGENYPKVALIRLRCISVASQQQQLDYVSSVSSPVHSFFILGSWRSTSSFYPHVMSNFINQAPCPLLTHKVLVKSMFWVINYVKYLFFQNVTFVVRGENGHGVICRANVRNSLGTSP